MLFTQQYRDLWLISILLRLITGSISAALSAKAVAYLIPEVSGALGMVAGFALFVCVEYVGKDSLAGKLSWELTQTPRYPAWIVGIWLMFIACFAGSIGLVYLGVHAHQTTTAATATATDIQRHVADIRAAAATDIAELDMRRKAIVEQFAWRGKLTGQAAQLAQAIDVQIMERQALATTEAQTVKSGLQSRHATQTMWRTWLSVAVEASTLLLLAFFAAYKRRADATTSDHHDRHHDYHHDTTSDTINTTTTPPATTSDTTNTTTTPPATTSDTINTTTDTIADTINTTNRFKYDPDVIRSMSKRAMCNRDIAVNLGCSTKTVERALSLSLKKLNNGR